MSCTSQKRHNLTAPATGLRFPVPRFREEKDPQPPPSSSGLGHGLLKAGTGVRLPLGVLVSHCQTTTYSDFGRKRLTLQALAVFSCHRRSRRVPASPAPTAPDFAPPLRRTRRCP